MHSASGEMAGGSSGAGNSAREQAGPFSTVPVRGPCSDPLARGAYAGDDQRMVKINIDFSKLPGDVALLLAQQEHTEHLARDLANAMRLDDPERQFLHDEIVGSVAKILEKYLP